ncbi:hypothetical protein-putative related to sulfatases [hydrothermal vent metagenome]|uniref:Sulfatase n=1 Tax=hydrothermal vent metagenome TaxID=652676 RepID=A0A3B1DUX1_9ZZZZ
MSIQNQQNSNEEISRRQALKGLGCGLGYLATSGLAAQAEKEQSSNLLLEQAPHFPPKAKRVIFLFMRGGPSQMDTFDYKPLLNKSDGKVIDKKKKTKLFGSPWKFKQHGESGLHISELYPHVAQCADDLCLIRSMKTDSRNHPRAMPLMHTGSFAFIRPSIGSWVLYGLGSANDDLPGFITINPSRVFGGPANFGSAFLPSSYAGARIGWEGKSLKNAKFHNVTNKKIPRTLQREQMKLLRSMNGQFITPEAQGVTDSFELGVRMQDVAPHVMDISQESKGTLKQYGIGKKKTDNFGRQCLLARRFAEQGVRFIELGHGSWDHHQVIRKGLPKNCQGTDQPIAALITDLKQRGLLEETLIVWGGEFGRLPYLEFGTGRGHNAEGFTFWMAGGGAKGGYSHGETDEFGYKAVKDMVHLYDLHATILHLLGLDHKKLTYRYGGRDFRLTDIHGNVVKQIVS